MTITITNSQPVIHDAAGKPMDVQAGIRAIRKEQGWSVATMAEACGVSPRTVEGWEQGRYQPTKPAMLALRGVM
jgi:DNA-binding transcriptional regulator YiaG